jgi:hypothetical protein
MSKASDRFVECPAMSSWVPWAIWPLSPPRTACQLAVRPALWLPPEQHRGGRPMALIQVSLSAFFTPIE